MIDLRAPEALASLLPDAVNAMEHTPIRIVGTADAPMLTMLSKRSR